MLNGDQKQYGKRITEDREVGVIRLMPRYGRSMSLPSFYPGRPDGATSETWIQEKQQFVDDGESCWGQGEIQVFDR